jgi:hypothetical protein
MCSSQCLSQSPHGHFGLSLIPLMFLTFMIIRLSQGYHTGRVPSSREGAVPGCRRLLFERRGSPKVRLGVGVWADLARGPLRGGAVEGDYVDTPAGFWAGFGG